MNRSRFRYTTRAAIQRFVPLPCLIVPLSCAIWLSLSGTNNFARAAQNGATRMTMDWYQLNNKAGTLLAEAKDQRVFIGKLTSKSANHDLEDELILLDVLIRVGHFDDATALVKKFATVAQTSAQSSGARGTQPSQFTAQLTTQYTPQLTTQYTGGREDPQRRLLSDAAHFLIEKKAFSTAKSFVEQFPQASPGYGFLLLQQMAKSDGAGATDSWVLSIAKASPDDFWLEQRLRWRADNHTDRPLFDEMYTQLKKEPSKFVAAQRFIHLVNSVNSDNKPDLKELADVLKPKMAYECFLLGLDLQMQTSGAAAALYERSLALPFTADDKKLFSKYVSTHWAIACSPAAIDWESYLRQSTKENLVQAYKNSHQIEKAQKLIVELSNAQASGLPALNLSTLAGQIQAQSSVHPIENKIRAAEPENTQSSEYWLTRATYYFGRKDKPATVAAYEKAISLCSLKTESDKRGAILNTYHHSLRELGASDDEIVRLLTREYQLALPNTHYMQCVISEALWFDERQRTNNKPECGLIKDDKKLWEHLEMEKVWLPDDQRLLLRLAEQSSGDKKTQFWNRAIALTANADCSKAYWLGSAMKRSGRLDLALTMFQRTREQAVKFRAAADKSALSQDLIKKSADDNMLSMAQSDMFACLIDLNDWKGANLIWQEEKAKASLDTKQSYLAQLSLAAARAKDKDQSMRFWKEKTAIDRNELGWLHAIASAGMKSDLTDFYKKMSEDDPHSNTPALALSLLEKVKN